MDWIGWFKLIGYSWYDSWFRLIGYSWYIWVDRLGLVGLLVG